MRTWTMDRCVEAEWLDQLPADDPDAAASRRDLRRLNAFMGHARCAAEFLRSSTVNDSVFEVVDLGGGDGSLLLAAARRLGPLHQAIHATIVDRQNLVLEQTHREFAKLGWEVETAQADIFDWLRDRFEPANAVILCNLFLHHFSRRQIAALFCEATRSARAFLALEPRRCFWSLGFSYLVWMIGCEKVTRHDAPASVRAGFRDRELSELWPQEAGWRLDESAIGLFSHRFVAARLA